MSDGSADAEEQLAALSGAAVRHDVAFEGRRVTWRKFGDGPPLVLLHGGHGSWLHWARNIGPWSAGHAVWAPDLPGYGDSDTPAEPSLDSLIAATTGTLNAVVPSAQPIALVGFSFGALVAASVAARHSLVYRLALLGPVGHGLARRFNGQLRSWRDVTSRGDDAALAERMRHNLASFMLHAPDAADALALRIYTEGCLRARFASRDGALGDGLSRALRVYRGPLLLMWGEHDPTAIPEHAAPALCAGREACSAHVFPGAGHWVQYERAAEVNRLLLGWLADHAPGRSCS